MNIISFCPYYPPHLGGLENYSDELHAQLASRGHNITVFTTNIPPSSFRQNKDNISIIRFPAFDLIFGYPIPKFWHPQFLRALQLIWHSDHDVIISVTRFFLTSLLALLFAKLRRIPWLHIEHGSDYVTSTNFLISVLARLHDETLGLLVFNQSSVNVAPSLSAQKFIKHFDSRPAPLIYRGLPFDLIDNTPPDKELIDNHSQQTIICYAGRLIEAKGLIDLIRATLPLISLKIHILIVGSGPMAGAISDEIKKYKLQQFISLLGQKSFSQTISIFKSSDIIVNPSYNEGLPTSILEASACSIATIATDVGGTPEIITHNKSGLLFRPGQISTLAAHIRTLVTNPSLRNTLGQSANTNVRSKFSWTKATDQYLHVISQIKP